MHYLAKREPGILPLGSCRAGSLPPLFPPREALVLDAATGLSVCGRLSFNRNKAKHRSLDITLQVAAMRAGQESTEDVLASSAAQAQLFTMGVSSGD